MTLKSRAVFILVFQIATAVLLSFSTAVAAPDYFQSYEAKAEDLYRPPSFFEPTPFTIKKWHSYLNWLSTQGQPQVAKEFYWIQRSFAFQIGSPKIVELLKIFQEKRSILPTEIRWLLAALEIQSNTIAKETFEDAKSAIRHIDITESSSFMGMGGGIDQKVLYRGVHPAKGSEPEIIELYSLTDLAILHRSWQKVAVLDKDFKTDVVLDRKRNRWLQVIATMTSYFIQGEAIKLIQDFDNPKMRVFTNETTHHEFLWASLNVMKKFGLKFGEISFNQHGDVNFRSKSDNDDGFSTIRARVKNWLAESLTFNIQNFTTLSREELISLDTLLSRPATESDKEVLAQFIATKKIKVDSQIVAALMWMKQQGEADKKTYIEAVTLVYDALIANATVSHGAIKVSSASIEGTHFTPQEYAIMLKEFYSMLGKSLRLTHDQAKALVKKQSLKIPGMTDLEWQQVEWARYLSLENSLPREDLLEHLVQVAANEVKSELVDRVLAAEFIRKRIKPKNLQEIATRVKVQAQGVKASSYKSTDDKVWAKNGAELVTVMRSLDPSDHEMHKFLSNIYSGRNFDGPIAGQTALSLLTDSGQGNE